jgi:hypothetical protein
LKFVVGADREDLVLRKPTQHVVLCAGSFQELGQFLDFRKTKEIWFHLERRDVGMQKPRNTNHALRENNPTPSISNQ